MDNGIMAAARARRAPSIIPRETARDRAKNARQEAYRDLVLEAAGSAFARQGVPNTKMEELAEQAGLSLGTLYSVYKGKAEIVDALHEARLREIHSASIEAELLEVALVPLLGSRNHDVSSSGPMHPYARSLRVVCEDRASTMGPVIPGRRGLLPRASAVSDNSRCGIPQGCSFRTPGIRRALVELQPRGVASLAPAS